MSSGKLLGFIQCNTVLDAYPCHDSATMAISFAIYVRSHQMLVSLHFKLLAHFDGL